MVSSVKPLLRGISGPPSRLFSASVLDTVFFEDALVAHRGSKSLEIQTVREWIYTQNLLRWIGYEIVSLFDQLFRARVVAPTEEATLTEILDTLNSTSVIEGARPTEVSKKTVIRSVRDFGTFLDLLTGGRPWNKAPRKPSDFTSMSKPTSPFVRVEKKERSFWERK